MERAQNRGPYMGLCLQLDHDRLRRTGARVNIAPHSRCQGGTVRAERELTRVPRTPRNGGHFAAEEIQPPDLLAPRALIDI
jgi:hypothetical protein